MSFENFTFAKAIAVFCWALLMSGYLFGGTERAIAWSRDERPEAGWLFWFAAGCGLFHLGELLFIF